MEDREDSIAASGTPTSTQKFYFYSTVTIGKESTRFMLQGLKEPLKGRAVVAKVRGDTHH